MKLARPALITLFLAALVSGGALCSVAFAESAAESKLERAKDLLESHTTTEAAPQTGLKGLSAWTPEEEHSMSTAGLRMFQGLALCVGLLLVVSWAYRKYGLKEAPATGRSMRVIERLQVSGRSSVLLAEVEGRKILVGVGADPVTMLDLSRSMTPDFDISLEKAL